MGNTMDELDTGMPKWQLYMIVLFISQLTGAVGDLIGSRCTRVIYGGSSTRMLIGSASIGAMIVISALIVSEVAMVTAADGRPLVRVGSASGCTAIMLRPPSLAHEGRGVCEGSVAD